MSRALRMCSLARCLPFFVVALAACVGDNNATNDGGTDSSTCTRMCNGVCAPNMNDPATGCGAASCTPCPTLPNQASTCNAGACGGGACAAGYLDCNPSTPGCETKTDVNNCSKCGDKCGATNTSAVSCGTASAGDAGAPDASASDAGTSGSSTCQFTCNGAYAHCSTDDSTGCETNISTDQNNCGVCGHSCLGGLCVAGKCQAVTMIANSGSNGFGSLYGIVTNGTTLYGTNWYGGSTNVPSHGSVYTVPTNAVNASPTWIVQDNTSGAYGGIATTSITTNGNKLVYSVYRTSDQAAGLWTADFNGTNNSNVVPGGTDQSTCGATIPGTDIASVAFDTTYIYWTHDRTAGSPCPGVFRADPNGANTALHQSSTYLRSLVSDNSGTIYMVSHNGTYPNFSGIAVLATTGAAIDNAPLVIAQQGAPYAVQFDAQYVYWNDASNAHFYRTTKVPSTIQDVTPSSGMPTLGKSPFLVDTKNIYFFAGTTQSLYVMPKDGSAPPIVAFTFSTANDFAAAFTQDDTAVYFTSYLTPAVYRWAK